MKTALGRAYQNAAAKPKAGYSVARDRVETYFDRTATRTWERLTSDAPVSRIRATVRAGRDEMRALMLAQLSQDLTGTRILDAGCGPGMMSIELAQRGAEVVGVDIAPALIKIAQTRLPEDLRDRVTLVAGDMTDPDLGSFDHVLAMDSLIYYDAKDIGAVLQKLRARVRGKVLFTVAPRTPLLMAMWWAGRVFPKADRSPVMVPHSQRELGRHIRGLSSVGRINSGFYISTCLEQSQ